MNTGNLWTAAEEMKLLEEIGDQKPIEEIAKEHGRTLKAIEMRLESMIRKKYSKDHYTIGTLSTLFQKSENDISRIIQDIPKESTPKLNIGEEIGEIKQRLQKIETLLLKIKKKLDK